jgi:hypothetical protein
MLVWNGSRIEIADTLARVGVVVLVFDEQEKTWTTKR